MVEFNTPTTKQVLIDPELMRILGALGHGVPARMYAFGQQMTRDSDGSGALDEHEFLFYCLTSGFETTYKNLRKYLHAGDGVLWDFDQDTHRVYLYAPARATRKGIKGRLNAVLMALEANRPELVATNRPGAKLIAVPATGSKKTWYGNVLAAWHNSRADHTSNISLYTLGKLFGATPKTILSWNKAGRIHADSCVAQYTDNEHIPVKHAVPYLAESYDVEGSGRHGYEVRAVAQHSNIYTAPPMQERQHKRLPRERARASKLVYEAAINRMQPNGDCGATVDTDSVGFTATKRRNFYTNDDNLKTAFSRLREHQQHHTADHAAHFVRLGYDYKRRRWVFEQSSGGTQRTTINDQLPRFKADPIFANNGGRGSIVAAWRSNN